MSEVEMRQALVGPTGKWLKFLMNKNNLDDMHLQKKLQMFEREKSYSILQLDHERIDAMEFMKHIRKREPDSQYVRKLVERSNLSRTPETDEVLEMEAKLKAKRFRKIRHKTAPARSQERNDRTPGQKGRRPQTEVISGSKLKLDHSKTTVETNRRKSMYLQIGGIHSDDNDAEDFKRIDLPKPSPKTMLDVMMGLNGFSHVPPADCATKSPDMHAMRKDNRTLLRRTSSLNSCYDSTENIASKFIQQWRAKVASRRDSIINKLAVAQFNPSHSTPRTPRWVESGLLSSVPELEQIDSLLDESQNSNWNVTTKQNSFETSYLPVPVKLDDDERRELFQAWMKERKDELGPRDIPNTENLDPKQKTEIRRQSFTKFLKERENKKSKKEENEEVTFAPIFKDPYDVNDEPQDIADMMKTILNIKKRFKDPLDFRVKKFYKELDKIKERDAQKPLTNKAIKRRWKMLMKGIDAALADSSDEDENNVHTI